MLPSTFYASDYSLKGPTGQIRSVREWYQCIGLSKEPPTDMGKYLQNVERRYPPSQMRKNIQPASLDNILIHPQASRERIYTQPDEK
jgi:hypothetical protein